MINSAKFLEISQQLEDHHSIFYTLWQLGKPVSDTSIPTACVKFDREGECLEFAFNPDYWNKCTDYDRLFVICHESLHVFLRHGVRVSAGKELHRCNIALDLVVNHMLVNKFGFDREKISNWEELIWVDTVFLDQHIATDLSYEQYFQLIPPQSELDTLDCHSWNADSNKWIERVAKDLGEEKNSLQDMVKNHSAGENPKQYWSFSADIKYIPPKKKWETVIKKWARKHSDSIDVEQWARINRRYNCLQSEFIIPTEMEVEHDKRNKINVWFFQDTSGSCYQHSNRFFAAAKSLPKDRFNVKLHCFDTEVYETTIESGKLYGFGSTAFSPIEKYIQKYISKNNIAYPQAVFVITDGFGAAVTPEKPERWFWFLSSTFTRWIPKKSQVFNLKDFE